MEATNKQPRLLKPDPAKKRKKKLLLYGLAAFVVVAAAAAVYYFHFGNTRQARSNKLAGTVTHLKNSQSSCADGLKQVQPDASKLGNSATYDNSSREQALNYLMKCEFLTNNFTRSLSYAYQLNGLYAADGNTQQQQQLAQFITIIKNAQK